MGAKHSAGMGDRLLPLSKPFQGWDAAMAQSTGLQVSLSLSSSTPEHSHDSRRLLLCYVPHSPDGF